MYIVCEGAVERFSPERGHCEPQERQAFTDLLEIRLVRVYVVHSQKGKGRWAAASGSWHSSPPHSDSTLLKLKAFPLECSHVLPNSTGVLTLPFQLTMNSQPRIRHSAHKHTTPSLR
jgi:hypothetical protein